MNLEGTQTLHNLMRAFAGESQARNRYTFAAQTAQAEGYQQIKNIFQETADNEKEHANVFYNYLVEGLQGNIPATVFLEHAGYPVFAGDTMENLNEAAHNEHEEWADIYPTFARTAREEGFGNIAASFNAICKAEEAHEQRFLQLYQHLKDRTVFKRLSPVTWRCSNCGFTISGTQAPLVCPACKHAQSYFETNLSF